MRTKRTIDLSAALGVCLLLLPLAGSAFYNPTAGRWLSRDPIGEIGSPNLYAHVRNRLKSAFDFLGLYELQYDLDADLSSAEKEKLEDFIKKAGETAKKVQQDAENLLKKGCPCPKAKRELEKLIEVMKKVVSGAASPSENLEIETKELPGKYAELKPGGGFFDPVLRLNNGSLNWSAGGDETQLTIFHELTHIYKTEDDDSKGEFMNAHTIEKLLDGIERSTAYRGLLLDCKRK